MKNILFFVLIISIFMCGTIEIDAAKAKSKSLSAEELLEKGRTAFLNYDFEEAADMFDQYRTAKSKAKQEVDEGFEELEAQLEIATNSFDRVQKIVIIDSLSVPRKTFYNSYRLASSAGKIGDVSQSFKGELPSGPQPGFISEEGDYVISVAPKDGNLGLVENYKLLDGTWMSRETLTGDFEKTGNYAYPFMSSDGQTLYFANDGEESMGGYDLFVAQKDPISGEYRQPLNLGMPFNSPFDDIMMALDEENGIGWWATDRNSPDGKITIYVYLVDEIRKNYPDDTENLVELARIDNYKATWQPGKEKEYKAKLNSLPEEAALQPESVKKERQTTARRRR